MFIYLFTDQSPQNLIYAGINGLSLPEAYYLEEYNSNPQVTICEDQQNQSE